MIEEQYINFLKFRLGIIIASQLVQISSHSNLKDDLEFSNYSQ